MATAVTCRGCSARVSRTASFCYICKCPDPTRHVSHMAPAEPLPVREPPAPKVAAWK
jgi:hypothetical protein